MKDPSNPASVGVGALDADHKLLLEIAATLQRALTERRSEMAMAGGDVLAEAARAHFRREEDMMAAGAFPLEEDHRLGHAVFLDLIDQMRFDIDRGLWLPAQARLGEAATMLHSRLLIEDADYGRWLGRTGLVPIYQENAFAGWEKEPRDRIKGRAA